MKKGEEYMEKVNLTLSQNLPLSDKRLFRAIGPEIIRRVFIILLGILMGRAIVFSTMTPIAIGYFSAVYMDKKNRVWIFISVLFGLATSLTILDVSKYLLMMFLIMSFNAYIDTKGKQTNLFQQAVVAGSSGLLIALVTTIMQPNNIQNVYYALLESFSIFSLVLVYGRGLKMFQKKQQVSHEAVISLAILLSTAVAGIAGIRILGFDLVQIWLFTTILYLGYRFGIGTGAVVGLVSGVIITVLGGYTSDIIGILGITGILSGLFREVGKLGCMIGCLLGGVGLWYYYEPLGLQYEMIQSLVISIGIFLLLPNNKERSIQKAFDTIQDPHQESIQQLLRERLTKFSQSFEKLGSTFNQISQKKTSLSQDEINHLLDDIAEKVCGNCPMRNICWKREFYDTYRAVFGIISAVENKNEIQQSDVPEVFYKKCIKPDEFIATTNRLFEIYKMNLNWENRIVESRELIAQQFYSISKIIKAFSNQIYKDIQFDTQLEEIISKAFKKYRIAVSDVIVYKMPDGRMRINLKVKSSSDKSKYMRDMIPVLNKLTGRKLRMEEGCKFVSGHQYCEVKFIENEVFRIAKGVARLSKNKQALSGDNYTFITLPNGQDIIALSDGMGTGKKAFLESSAAIELLEQLLEAGFDGDTALKMINSILVLKSSEQTYSTLDMSVIDRYTGLCEFIKIGAASSFIKRNDKVEIIKSTSLPMGMFNKVEYEESDKKLKDGDMVIMVTDGIVDSEKKEMEKEKWVEKALRNIDSRNPQDIADYLLEKAKQKSEGSEGDDMTVLVLRLWEKIA